MLLFKNLILRYCFAEHRTLAKKSKSTLNKYQFVSRKFTPRTQVPRMCQRLLTCQLISTLQI